MNIPQFVDDILDDVQALLMSLLVKLGPFCVALMPALFTAYVSLGAALAARLYASIAYGCVGCPRYLARAFVYTFPNCLPPPNPPRPTPPCLLDRPCPPFPPLDELPLPTLPLCVPLPWLLIPPPDAYPILYPPLYCCFGCCDICWCNCICICICSIC